MLVCDKQKIEYSYQTNSVFAGCDGAEYPCWIVP